MFLNCCGDFCSGIGVCGGLVCCFFWVGGGGGWGGVCGLGGGGGGAKDLEDGHIPLTCMKS